MKSVYVSISIIFVIVSTFFISRDYLAGVAWEKYGQANLALALVSSDSDISMQLGNYYFNGGAYDLDKAETAFKKALLDNPKVLWGHYQLSRIYLVRGDFKNALKEAEKELEANPGNLRIFYVRGIVYGYRGWDGDLEKAEADFRDFVEWAPKEWAGYNDLVGSC